MLDTRLRVTCCVVVLAVLVGLAGCNGGGGTATPTPTATPDPAVENSDGGDGGDMTATATPDSMAAETPTPTPTPSPTPTSEPATDSGDNEAAFSTSDHAAGLREAGSYTAEYNFTGFGSEGTSSISGTERVNVDTGQRYSSVMTSADGQAFTAEFYSPPDSETVYRHIQGQTQETSPEQAFFFNLSEAQESEDGPQFDQGGYREDGTEETNLGTATRYVIDSAEDLPESTRDNYDSVESVELVVLVDQDTDVIASINYDITAVQDGQEQSQTFEYTVTNLGSTTVEEPEWAP